MARRPPERRGSPEPLVPAERWHPADTRSRRGRRTRRLLRAVGLLRPAGSLQGYARRHYTRDEVERASSLRQADILLLHDAPAGIEFVGRYPSGDVRRYRSEAAGLGDVVTQVRPAICFFGHHHRRVDAEIDGVRCIGLNAVGRPGNLVAFELERGGDARLLGEWPSA